MEGKAPDHRSSWISRGEDARDPEKRLDFSGREGFNRWRVQTHPAWTAAPLHDGGIADNTLSRRR